MILEQQLSQNQKRRRDRVLRAALDLADTGGYHGVQMRDVANRAGVALGTVYNYFVSKDHLLAVTLVEWTRELAQSVKQNPAEGDTTLEKVLNLLHRMTFTTQSNQRIAAAIVGGLIAEGEQVAACHQEIHETFTNVLETAFEPGFDTTNRDQIIRTLQNVWFSQLIFWKNGWFPIERCVQELEDTAKMFLADEQPASASAVTSSARVGR